MDAATNVSALLPAIVADRGLAAILSLLINVAGLTAYGIVIYILIKDRKEFNNPFYTLVLALAGPDCLTGILELIYAIPARLIDERRFPYWYQTVIGFASVSSWFMLLSITVVISFNRLVAVLFLNVHKHLFTPNRLTTIIMLCYLYGFSISSMMYACQCRLKFPDYAWLFDCNLNGTCASNSLKVNEILSDVSLALIIFFYLVVFIQVRRKHGKVIGISHTSEQLRKEMQLLFQFAAISCGLLAYESTFWIIPPLMENQWISWRIGTIIINTCCNINSCISPFLYLTFSSDIRQKLVCGKTTIVKAISISNPPGRSKHEQNKF